MLASYLESNAFAVTGDRTAAFLPGVRIAADCGADGARYGTVSGASYAVDTDLTSVTLSPDADGLTAALAAVLHGNDIPASLANHGHTGQADGGAVSHAALSGAGTNSHAVLDAFLASKAAASGLATLDASSRVVQNPANATATPGGTKIVIADASGTVDAWVSDATASVKGKVRLATTAETQAGSDAAKAVTPAGLAASAKGLIASNTTLYVATTGSDATGDGSSGAPFASIAQALYSIRNKLIASGVTVTIQVADGTYAVSSTITIDHPDADKIRILGNTSAETTVAIAAIDVGAKTITVAGNYVSNADAMQNIEVGHVIGLTGSGTSGLNGAYLVSDVSYDETNTIITCSAETFASSTVGGGSIVIKPCNRCKLQIGSGVMGFFVKTRILLIEGFVIQCNHHCFYADTSSAINIGRNIILGAWHGVWAGINSVSYVYGCLFKNCYYAVYAISDGKVVFGDSTVLSMIDSSVTTGAFANGFSHVSLYSSACALRNNAANASPAFNVVGNNNSLIERY